MQGWKDLVRAWAALAVAAAGQMGQVPLPGSAAGAFAPAPACIPGVVWDQLPHAAATGDGPAFSKCMHVVSVYGTANGVRDRMWLCRHCVAVSLCDSLLGRHHPHHLADLAP